MDQALRRLADRFEIDDVLSRYATAVDTRDWDLLDQVFAPDAHLDYRSAGGVAGPYPEVRAWLAEVLPIFTWTQHLVVNRTVELGPDGDHARCRSIFHNPNELDVGGSPWRFTVGGRYHDRFVRTGPSWRIASRVEVTLWWDNPMPGLPAAPYPVPEDAADRL